MRHQRSERALHGGVMPGLRHRDAHRPAVGLAHERHRAAHRGEREVRGEVVRVGSVLPERADRDVHEIGPRLAQRRRSRARARPSRRGPRSRSRSRRSRPARGNRRGRARCRGRARRCACRARRRGSRRLASAAGRPGTSGSARRASDPLGRLDLDHVGAEPRQHHRPEPRARVGEVEDAVRAEGARGKWASRRDHLTRGRREATQGRELRFPPLPQCPRR